MYGTVSNFRKVAGKAVREQMEAGFLLPVDAETLYRETIERVDF